MTTDDEDTGAVRAGLDRLAATAPPVHFTAGEVVRRGRRHRQLRRGALLAGAAGALAVVVVVPTVALRGDGGGTRIAAAGPGSTSPAPKPTRTTPQPTRTAPKPTATVRPAVPGLTPAEADRIARGCAASSGQPVPGVQVYNLIRDAIGTHALIYGRGTFISCDVLSSPVRYIAGEVASGGDEVTEWLPGVLEVDGSSGAEGGQPRKDVPGNGHDSPGYRLIEGRVTSAVARLTVTDGTDGTDRAELRPRNGTFVVRFVHSSTWRTGGKPEVIKAYDAHGRLLGTWDPENGIDCYQTPAGQVVAGKYEAPTPDCKPAQRWR